MQREKRLANTLSTFTYQQSMRSLPGVFNMSWTALWGIESDFCVSKFLRIIWLPLGELTLEEFISGVEKDGDLMELITKSFDLSNVLKVIQNGRRHSVWRIQWWMWHLCRHFKEDNIWYIQRAWCPQSLPRQYRAACSRTVFILDSISLLFFSLIFPC